ncbi:hypothetical protein AV530_000570 [Patagioenas fasciata monilis]|uniref:Uncharacterized protein n=1 Tax=Patagioenas fasciata monilis TaxID=372326 RepID=A0A1V4IG55_PATFA|nr:hypothetical protein AV530_000570 [Patagioenas fasciata monilis]
MLEKLLEKKTYNFKISIGEFRLCACEVIAETRRRATQLEAGLNKHQMPSSHSRNSCGKHQNNLLCSRNTYWHVLRKEENHQLNLVMHQDYLTLQWRAGNLVPGEDGGCFILVEPSPQKVTNTEPEWFKLRPSSRFDNRTRTSESSESPSFFLHFCACHQ